MRRKTFTFLHDDKARTDKYDMREYREVPPAAEDDPAGEAAPGSPARQLLLCCIRRTDGEPNGGNG
jgi:hypothetical protein